MGLEDSLRSKKATFFVGKGGVGKTTLAASVGISLADHLKDGQRILVASTDPAHSLTDVLQLPYSSEKTRVYPDLPLDIVQIEPRSSDEYTGVHSALRFFKFLSDRGMPIDVDSVSCMISLAEYAVNLEASGYSRLIIDSEPTAGLFRMLDLPENIDKNLRRLSRNPLVPFAVEVLSGMSRKFKKLAAGDFKKDAKTLSSLLTRFKAMLYDHSQAGFVVVASPERDVVAETYRLIEELRRYGFSVDGVVFNRFLGDRYDPSKIRAAQNELLREFQSVHTGIPVNRVPYQGTDNLDRGLLYRIGNRLLNSRQSPIT